MVLYIVEIKYRPSPQIHGRINRLFSMEIILTLTLLVYTLCNAVNGRFDSTHFCQQNYHLTYIGAVIYE